MSKSEEVLGLIRTGKVPEVKTEDLPEGVAKLAGEAVVLLGYTGYSKYLKTTVLLKKLEELEIEVLDHSAVVEYMLKYGRVSDNLQAQLGTMTSTEEDDDREESSSSDDDVPKVKSRSFNSWETMPLSRYKKAIPAHVLNKAVGLKKALPEVEFEIVSLVKDPDPFLLASLGREHYLLEVWDEPRFEGRATRETKSKKKVKAALSSSSDE